jgi:AraC-like DNA-binding protein
VRLRGLPALMEIYYRTCPPSAPLRPFIRELLLLDLVAGPGEVVPAKTLAANTEQCLVFYLRGQVTAVNPASGTRTVYAPIALNGTQSTRFDIYSGSPFRLLSVQFQPGVLTKFLRLPLPEFTNARIDAEAVLGAEIRQVQEQLVHAPTYAALLQQVEAYLWRRIQRLRLTFAPFDRALQALSAMPHAYALDQLAHDACLSVSQLERRFVQQLGVGPKLYTRIARFSQAHALKHAQPELDWLHIAVSCGYYDYQHLVKDFRQFAHATPPALLLAQAQAPDRLARLLG